MSPKLTRALTRKIPLGDVVICLANVSDPYRGPSLMGRDRFNALHDFKEGNLDGSVVAWCAPAHGGAYILVNPRDVNWSGLRPRGTI